MYIYIWIIDSYNIESRLGYVVIEFTTIICDYDEKSKNDVD